MGFSTTKIVIEVEAKKLMNKARKRRKYKKRLVVRAFAKLRKNEMPTAAEACEAISVADAKKALDWARRVIARKMALLR